MNKPPENNQDKVITKKEKDSRLMLYDNELLTPKETPFFSGWVKQEKVEILKNHKPLFVWNKSKIPEKLWRQIVTFMRWGYTTYRSEVLVSLFYNTEEDDWAAWAFPQKTQGMTVQFLHKHVDYAKDRAQFKNGWVQLGSVHHHCAMGAFQSGPDEEDEKDREGVHFTLGKMDKPELDIHVRQTFKGMVGEIEPIDFLEEPKWLKNIPKVFKKDIKNKVFTTTKDLAFPEIWKSRVTKEVPVFNRFGTGTQSEMFKKQAFPNTRSKNDLPLPQKTYYDEEEDDDWGEDDHYIGSPAPKLGIQPATPKKETSDFKATTPSELDEKLETQKRQQQEFLIVDSCESWQEYLKSKFNDDSDKGNFRVVWEEIIDETNFEEFGFSQEAYLRLARKVEEIVDFAECPEDQIVEFLVIGAPSK